MLRTEFARSGRLMVDIVVLAAGVVVVVGLVEAADRSFVSYFQTAQWLLTLVAAGAGASAAALGQLAALLADDRRTAWLSAALGVYSLVVLPLTIFRPNSTEEAASLQAARLVAYVVIVALLCCAVRPPRQLGTDGAWVVAGSGALLAVAVSEAARRVPDRMVVTIAPLLRNTAVLTWWLLSSIVLVVLGWRRTRQGIWRVGLGLGLVGSAHYAWVPVPGEAGQLLFSLLQLLGLVVVAVGATQLAREAVRGVVTERDRQTEELHRAALHLSRASKAAAERDHELRNGLAGLAGAAELLGSSTNPLDESLRTAVLAELDRLRAMLQPQRTVLPAAGVPDLRGLASDVRSVLYRLVELRRCGGMAVDLDVPAALQREQAPPAFAQVLTNLLDNCSRHAAGATVHVRARCDGRRVVVEVGDSGPGIPPDCADRVLERGVRGPLTGGSGLGLDISARLVASMGGNLRLLSTGPGCTAVIDLPARVRSG